MICPFCGNEMQSGVIKGDGRITIRWVPDGEKLHFIDRVTKKCMIKAAKYSFSRILTIDADYCTKCKKMIFDTEVND